MWKVLFVEDHGYEGVKLITPYMDYEYKYGCIRSNRYSKKLDDYELYGNTVEEGIHVFTNKKQALWVKKDEFNNEGDCLVVPVTVHQKDFMYAGDWYDAVFMKVFLKKADYYKAIEELETL